MSDIQEAMAAVKRYKYKCSRNLAQARQRGDMEAAANIKRKIRICDTILKALEDTWNS